MKTEYFEEIKNLISENYTPVQSLLDKTEFTKPKTLDDIFSEVTSIIPKEWVYRSNIYEALKELGFKSFMYDVPAVRDEEDNVIIEEKTIMVYLMEIKTAAI